MVRLRPIVRNGDISAQAGPTWSCSLGGLALAVAIHELATNATKYGALSTSERVDVAWSVAAFNGVPHIRFTWTESGGPPVSAPAPKASARVSLNRCWDALLPER